MHSTLPHLQSAIRQSLQKGALCRIYKESLDACFPSPSWEDLNQALAGFATQNHWTVTTRDLGRMGLVAEFERAA